MTTATVSPMTTVWKQTSRVHPEAKESRESFGEADLFRVVGHGCTRRGYPGRLATSVRVVRKGAGRGQTR